MNREGQDTLLLFVGVMVLQVGITDLHLRYVKPQMQPLLIAAGVVLTALAVVSIVRTLRGRGPTVVTASPTEHVPGGALAVSHGAGPVHVAVEAGLGGAGGASVDGDGGVGGEGVAGREHAGRGPAGPAQGAHEHAHMPATAWLLALPLLVLTVLTPPALGAYAAARGTTTIDAPSSDVLPLPPPVDGAVDLSLTDFATRSLYAPDSVEGTPVRLTGFVLPEQDGWSLARIALSCCAADGRPVRVKVVGASPPEADSWVTVQGRLTRLEGEGARRVPVLAVDSLREVEAPTQQYE